MFAFFLAFISGVITVFAPCVFPLLPIIIGSGATAKGIKKLILIVSSLATSVFIFTILLRTLLLDNPLLTFLNEDFWRIFAGVLIAVFGIFSIYPGLWDKISIFFKLSKRSDQLLDKSTQRKDNFGSILLGFSLGPVFSSCSPTYFVIVGLLATESDRLRGVLLLLTYIVGLSLILLLIGFFGQKLVKKLRWASDPNGIFKKVFGLFLLLLGLVIIFRLDKSFETWLLNFDFYNNIFKFENDLTKGGSKLN
ncbi:MAG: cytochrome c biogenesis protein CcdA [bacterium]